MKDGWVEPGDMVKFLGENGYDGERAEAMKLFSPGHKYEVEDIEIGAWSHSISLKGFPGRYNGVMFEFAHTFESARKVATHRHYKGGLYREIRRLPDWTNGRDGQVMVLYEHLWPKDVIQGLREATEFDGAVVDSVDVQPRFMKLGPAS